MNAAKLERLVLRGNVAHGGDGGLHHEKIRAGFLGDRAESLGLLRNGTDRREHAACFEFLNAAADQLLLDRLEVNLLDQCR